MAFRDDLTLGEPRKWGGGSHAAPTCIWKVQVLVGPMHADRSPGGQRRASDLVQEGSLVQVRDEGSSHTDGDGDGAAGAVLPQGPW